MRQHRKKILVTFLALCVLFLVGYHALRLYSLYYQPMLKIAQTAEIFEIKKNSSATAMVRDLAKQGYIRSEPLLLKLIHFKGYDEHIKAGIYEIHPGESSIQFLKRVVGGDVLQQSFQIIEGTGLQQVKDNLSHANYLHYQPDCWYAIIDNHPSAEGLLLADTYQYNAGSDAITLVKMANQQLMQYLTNAWMHRTEGLPYQSPYELLIAASIIEKEASIPKERYLISGIIVNRLRKHMYLQMDPTVIYALGPNFQGKLNHQSLMINSPYNTYKVKGLPPTPIAMVGREAIDAAAHPQMTNYLYFFAKGDGSHQFSVDYQDQIHAIHEYR